MVIRKSTWSYLRSASTSMATLRDAIMDASCALPAHDTRTTTAATAMAKIVPPMNFGLVEDGELWQSHWRS